MDIKKICPGCMKEVDEREQAVKCPHCGYIFEDMNKADHQLRPFTILAGKYLVGKVIGEGGFGILYIGLDLNLEITVAIKEFYPAGFVTRESNNTTKVTMFAGKNMEDVNKWKDGFINEAKNLAKFSSLNGIVEVRDFFYENDTAYIVMEYIDGITLKQYLKENGGKIPVDNVLKMMEPVIRSLSKVHDAGMIHRDISPDNIMITKYGGMKLLDFGAARDFASNAEKSLSIMLKPGYAPEEQYRSHGKQGPWSDVYALTATMYKSITGMTPVESMERMREDTLKMPGELGIKISPDVEDTIRQGMAVYAEDRIQDMDSLYRRLYADPSKKAETVKADVIQEEKSQTKAAEAMQSDTKMPEIKIPEIKMPEINRQQLYLGIGAVGVLILIVACFALISVSKGSHGDEQVAVTSKANAEVAINETRAADEASSGAVAELQEMLSNKMYSELIDRVMRMESNEFYADEDAMREYARQAVVGHMNTAFQDVDALVTDGNYEAAFARLDEEIAYRNSIRSESRITPHADDNSAIDEKREQVIGQYAAYIDEIAYRKAEEKDYDGMVGILDHAAEILPEEELDRISQNAYRTLVIKVVDVMTSDSNYSPYTIMQYIDGFFEQTNYDAYLMELWDAQNSASGRTQTWTTTITHVSPNGYLLEGSDYRYIDESELYGFSQFELYLARWEIYARHHRSFVDNAVTRYFYNYSWYSASVPYSEFDENTLSDCEKENVKTIINYEKKCGYR